MIFQTIEWPTHTILRFIWMQIVDLLPFLLCILSRVGGKKGELDCDGLGCGTQMLTRMCNHLQMSNVKMVYINTIPDATFFNEMLERDIFIKTDNK